MRGIQIAILALLAGLNVYGQNAPKHYFSGSDGKRIYLPLGHISFADSISRFRLGFPRPKTIYRDSTMALGRPDYKGYDSPDFLSIGCKGEVTFYFKDNGFMNLEGPDLTVFEVGPARERTRVEISVDGKSWKFAGDAAGATSTLEFSDRGIDSTTIFKYVRLLDLKDECTGKSAGADIDAIAAINSVITLNIAADVFFDVDKHRLKPAAHTVLDSVAGTLRQIGKATIRIAGHTDSDAEEKYNLELSERRCRSVEIRLSKLLKGEGSFHFDLLPFGESRPRVPNDSPENKQLNRRVELLILPPKEYYDSIRKD